MTEAFFASKGGRQTVNNLRVVMNRPASHFLTYLRSANSPGLAPYREKARELTKFLLLNCDDLLPFKLVTVPTPLNEMVPGWEIDLDDLVFVSIVRGGDVMLGAARALFGDIKGNRIQIKRNEAPPFDPILMTSWLDKKYDPEHVVVVLDPMFATGGTACLTVKLLKERGARQIIFIGLVGAPAAVERMNQEHPDVQIVLAALDKGLNSKAYISPGLGDFGDRAFGPRE